MAAQKQLENLFSRSSRSPFGPRTIHGVGRLAVAAGWCVALLTTSTKAEPVAISPLRAQHDLQRVQVTLQVRGKLFVAESSDDKQPSSQLPTSPSAPSDTPMVASGRLTYHERLTSEGAELPISVRYYETAKAELQIAQHEDQVTLSDSRQWVVADATSGSRWWASGGPLTRSEQDLLRVPGNSLTIYQLLPQKAVNPGQKLPCDSVALASLLNIDEVTVNEATITLDRVEQGLAVFAISGEIMGNVDGTATRISLQGDLRFDMHWKHINWLQLTLRERRDASPFQAGFEIEADLRMLSAPLADSPLTPEIAEQLVAKAKGQPTRFRHESAAGGYAILHDPRWHVVDDRTAGTALRMVDHGAVAAQCNVRRLQPRDPRNPLTLEEFKADIRQALGASFASFENSAQATRRDGYRVLRVAALGTASDLPIRWVYYHIANPEGEEAAIVFTMQPSGESNAKPAEIGDKLIVSSIQLQPLSTSKEAVEPPAEVADKGDRPQS